MAGHILCELADWPWNMIGAAISSASLIATIIIGSFVIHDVRRLDRPRKSSKSPGIAHFIISSSAHHNSEVARSDELEHRVKSITLPAHSVTTIDLYVESAVFLETSQVYFGFVGDFRGKPYFSEVFNQFITQGHRRSVVPGNSDNNDYIDKHKFYHAVEHWYWSIGDGKAYGFKIDTNEPGTYNLEINFLGDISAGKIADLKVVVEEKLHTLMHCVREEHMSKNCVAGLKPLIR
jgi:hypothetical protein